MDRKPNKKRRIPFQARCLVREVLSGKHKTIASAGQAAGYMGPGAYRALKNLRGTISEIMDQAGLSDAYLVQNCLHPLLHATRTKHFQNKGKVKDSREEPALEIRRDALDIALRIKGKYAPPAVEQAHKDTVQVIVLDCPRPKRDIPPPTMIEIARTSPSQNVLPERVSSPSQQATNVLPQQNVLPRNGSGSNGGKV